MLWTLVQSRGNLWEWPSSITVLAMRTYRKKQHSPEPNGGVQFWTYLRLKMRLFSVTKKLSCNRYYEAWLECTSWWLDLEARHECTVNNNEIAMYNIIWMTHRNWMTRSWPLIETRAIITKCPKCKVFDFLRFVDKVWLLDECFDFFKNVGCYLWPSCVETFAGLQKNVSNIHA